MVLNLVILALALFLVLHSLLRLEFPSILGPVQASGAQERWSVKILLPLVAAAALVLPFLIADPYDSLLQQLVPSEDLQSAVAIALGGTAAVLLCAVIYRGCGVPYAFVGAFFGCHLMVNGHLDWALVGSTAASWIAAPLLCAALSALFSAFFLRYTSRSGRHLAIADHRLLGGCMAASLLVVAAAVWNMGRLPGLFLRTVLGEGYVPAGIAVGAALLLYLFLVKGISAHTARLADTDLDFGTGRLLAVMLAMCCTFVLFSLPYVQAAGLTPTPLSASSLMMAALIGDNLVRKNASISADSIRKHLVATAAAPVLGLLVSYCLCMILGVTPEIGGWGSTLLPAVILLAIIGIVAGIYLYIRASRREARRKEILRAREEQAYSTQKALSALEVKVETNEKDLLNKLEIKRKELVDFAVGVSEQKAFMEKVYESLAEARTLPEAQKDKALEKILTELRERMYFTREMNDFYARTEVLHRDFNMHLKEAYPQLTEGDRKLANLLRQGFSSKYIASLMNITPKSVEIGRYRLRNKLGLSRSDNLVLFIKSI